MPMNFEGSYEFPDDDWEAPLPSCCECGEAYSEDTAEEIGGRMYCSDCAFDLLGPLKLAGVREVGRLRVKRAMDALVRS